MLLQCCVSGRFHGWLFPGARGSPWGSQGLAGRPVPLPQTGAGQLGAPGQHQHLSPSWGQGQTEARLWAFGWVCLGGAHGLAWQACPAVASLEQGLTASALTWGPGPGWGIYSQIYSPPWDGQSPGGAGSVRPGVALGAPPVCWLK